MRKLIALLIVAIFVASVPAYAHQGYADSPLVSNVQPPSPGAIRGFDPQPDPPGAKVGFDPQPEPPGTIRGFNPQPDPPHDPLRIIVGDGSV